MTYCGRCGRTADTGDHSECAARLTLEPPRYCSDCCRRMIVQITPTRWTANCSRHGERTSAARGA